MTYPSDPTKPAVSLTEAFAQSPDVLAALQRYEERKKAQAEKSARIKTQAPTVAGTCPHCGKQGSRVFEIAGRAFIIRGECCQRACFDDALSALRYFFHPQATEKEQQQAGEDYTRLRAKIRDTKLLGLLDAEELSLKGLAQRVSAAGGYCQGSAKQAQPESMVLRYDPGADGFGDLFN